MGMDYQLKPQPGHAIPWEQLVGAVELMFSPSEIKEKTAVGLHIQLETIAFSLDYDKSIETLFVRIPVPFARGDDDLGRVTSFALFLGARYELSCPNFPSWERQVKAILATPSIAPTRKPRKFDRHTYEREVRRIREQQRITPLIRDSELYCLARDHKVRALPPELLDAEEMYCGLHAVNIDTLDPEAPEEILETLHEIEPSLKAWKFSVPLTDAENRMGEYLVSYAFCLDLVSRLDGELRSTVLRAVECYWEGLAAGWKLSVPSLEDYYGDWEVDALCWATIMPETVYFVLQRLRSK